VLIYRIPRSTFTRKINRKKKRSSFLSLKILRRRMRTQNATVYNNGKRKCNELRIY